MRRKNKREMRKIGQEWGRLFEKGSMIEGRKVNKEELLRMERRLEDILGRLRFIEKNIGTEEIDNKKFGMRKMKEFIEANEEDIKEVRKTIGNMDTGENYKEGGDHLERGVRKYNGRKKGKTKEMEDRKEKEEWNEIEIIRFDEDGERICGRNILERRGKEKELGEYVKTVGREMDERNYHLVEVSRRGEKWEVKRRKFFHVWN